VVWILLRGVYALVISLSEQVLVEVGRLGRVKLGAGVYVYVGSGFGSASSSVEGRLTRHFRGAKHKHWHIDYLLGNPYAEPAAALFSEAKESLECRLAESILSDLGAEVAHKGFGASDCSCQGHLVHLRGLEVEATESLVWRKFEELGLRPKRWSR